MTGAPADLADARDSLDYWERREREASRLAIGRRREARAAAARWRAHVAAAERDAYGRGLLGALLLLVAEGRLPEAARHTSRRVRVRAVRTVAALTVLAVAVAVAGLVVAAELVTALAHALA